MGELEPDFEGDVGGDAVIEILLVADFFLQRQEVCAGMPVREDRCLPFTLPYLRLCIHRAPAPPEPALLHVLNFRRNLFGESLYAELPNENHGRRAGEFHNYFLKKPGSQK